MSLRKNLSNILGWKTNRKIVVIESDDWGSVRTSSSQAYQEMLKRGLNVDQNFFTKYDSLESNRDLNRLFDLLLSFKDSTDRPPVFTPMCIVANPDFQKIQESGYSEYHFQDLNSTIKSYPDHDNLIELWRKGAEERLFVPALHGREHLNVKRYMKGLNDPDNPGLKIAFEYQSIGASAWKDKAIIEYLGAFHPSNPDEIQELESILFDAIGIFKNITGYSPTHFIGPNKEPAKELDKTLAENGVKFITQSKLRKYPRGNDKYGLQFNWLGKKNRFGQTFIMRNSSFEPSGLANSFDSCLSEIETAFKWNKPVVISSHRANYVGYISQKNADFGLSELKRLLNAITTKWPEVEFMTTSELGILIESTS